MKNIWLILSFLAMILILSGCVKDPVNSGGTQSVYANDTRVNETVQNNTGQIPGGCAHDNPSCDSSHSCVDNSCVLKSGCQYLNPSCNGDEDCINNTCSLKSGCGYNNPSCDSSHSCVDNSCVLKSGCQYLNPSCNGDEDCINNTCSLKSGCGPGNPSCNDNNLCANPSADTGHMDIFDSHTHLSSTISAFQIISEMDRAGVSVANLYSGTLETASKYPGRFILFVDTPDSPQPSAWLTQGPAFTASAEGQLKTGKFYGIGEANLRYYGATALSSPPDIYVPPDTPLWLALVDLSAKYHVPISFHFVPNDLAANAAFGRMLNHNKNATLIWAHLGFNNMPLNRTAFNDFLLRYPNLYFDTAGIQNMQNPLPQPNSNWALLANSSDNGRMNAEWRQFFEAWNSRILFSSDAGGGQNGRERWLNYADKTVEGATPNAVGHWKSLLSNLDSNSARNILGGNARQLFLKEPRPPYNYSVSSDGKCYSILISSNSSVSGFAFDRGARVITFTVADSDGAAGSATIIIPTILLGQNLTAMVDGQSVHTAETSNSAYTTLRLEYAGGIRTVALSALTQ